MSFSFIFSVSILFAFIILAGLLLWKLKGVKIYNLMIFLSLTAFWVVASAMTNNVQDNYKHDWVWPIAISLYQITQAVTRVPIGIISQKLRSRKVPLIGATLIMLIGISMVIASDSATWSLIIGMIFTGVYGATFGLQNQYWAENYDLKKVFISITMVGMMPVIGDYLSKTISHSTDDLDWRWILLVSFGLALVTLILYTLFIKERKDTMRLDNMEEVNKHVSHLGLKEVFKMSLGILFLAFAFEMVRSTSIHKYFASNHTSQDDASVLTLLVSAITAIMTIVVSLFLIRNMRAENIMRLGQLIMVASLIFGFTLVLTNVLNIFVWYIFIGCVSIGYTMYSIVMLGTMLHFDLKNPHLVLGVWLSFRSFGVGAGQLTSNEILVNAKENEIHTSMIIIFAIALAVSLIAAIRTMLINKKINIPVFKMVDFYEYHKYNAISK